MRDEDLDLSDHDAEFYGGDGEIYVVGGSRTPSGKPYVGSANDKAQRAKTARDGRDRSQAQTVDRFPRDRSDIRKKKEQQAMDDRGGIENLDNKRNEIKKK